MKLIKWYLIYKFLYSWLILLFWSTIHWASEPKTSALHRPEPCMPAVPGQMRELPSEAPGIPYRLPGQRRLKNPLGAQWILMADCANFAKNPANSERNYLDKNRSAIARLGCLANLCLAPFWHCDMWLMWHGDIWWYYMILSQDHHMEMAKLLEAVLEKKMQKFQNLGSDNVPPGSPELGCLPFFILYPFNRENKSTMTLGVHESSPSFQPRSSSEAIRCWGPDCVETSCGVGEVGIDVGEFQIQVLRFENRWKKNRMAQIGHQQNIQNKVSFSFVFIGFHLLRLFLLATLQKLHSQGTKWTLIRLDTAKSSICSRLKSLTLGHAMWIQWYFSWTKSREIQQIYSWDG